MRIPFKIKFTLLKTKKHLLEISFAKNFSCKETIISLGCACHPSHVIEAMRFRKFSLPFDWLLTDSIKGLLYVNENIKNKFEYFCSDLKRNSENLVYASKFPYSVFFHHAEIIDSVSLLNTFKKRCDRFMGLFHSKNCVFLYSTTASGLASDASVQLIIKSAEEFLTLKKSADRLLIYIICEENTNENKPYCDNLINALNKLENVKCTRFVLESKKYGLWGYENNYSGLLRELGLKISYRLPSIKFNYTKL